jgi:hypothetical protein
MILPSPLITFRFIVDACGWVIVAGVGQKYNVQTRGVVVDFNKPSEEAFSELKTTAEELEISVLSELFYPTLSSPG